jgi:hypothetical protein
MWEGKSSKCLVNIKFTQFIQFTCLRRTDYDNLKFLFFKMAIALVGNPAIEFYLAPLLFPLGNSLVILQCNHGVNQRNMNNPSKRQFS